MFEYYAQHPLYAVLVIAFALVALFALFKAGMYSEKRSKENQKIMDKLKKENHLRNDFAILSKDLINNSENDKLFAGVGLNLQKRVADKKDMAAEFESLTKAQQFVYSVYTFTEDSEESMSNFFRINTKPLTETACNAIREVMGGDFSSFVESEYNAYDSDNEEVSCIPSEIEELDKKAAPFISEGTVADVFGRYIKDNYSDFIK